MGDRELLELAAKAAGMAITWQDGWNGMEDLASCKGKVWNPLTDDGDALRLAVKLGVVIDIRYTEPASRKYNKVGYWLPKEHEETYRVSEFDLHECALTATRRAIVRAAAEIGKSLP